MRLNIERIGDIDTAKDEFTCDLTLTVKWEEPRLPNIKEWVSIKR